jgi:hypothetical protein
MRWGDWRGLGLAGPRGERGAGKGSEDMAPMLYHFEREVGGRWIYSCPFDRSTNRIRRLAAAAAPRLPCLEAPPAAAAWLGAASGARRPPKTPGRAPAPAPPRSSRPSRRRCSTSASSAPTSRCTTSPRSSGASSGRWGTARRVRRASGAGGTAQDLNPLVLSPFPVRPFGPRPRSPHPNPRTPSSGQGQGRERQL